MHPEQEPHPGSGAQLTEGWWTPALHAPAAGCAALDQPSTLLPVFPFLAWLAGALGPVRLLVAEEAGRELAAALRAAGLVEAPAGDAGAPFLRLGAPPGPCLLPAHAPVPPGHEAFSLSIDGAGLVLAAPPGTLPGQAAALLHAARDPAEAARIAAFFGALGRARVLAVELARARALAEDGETRCRALAEELADARRVAAVAQARATQEAARRRAIENSTIWRTGLQLAALLEANPSVSRTARRGARLLWHKVLRPLLGRRRGSAEPDGTAVPGAVPGLGAEAALCIPGVGTVLLVGAPRDTGLALLEGGRRTEPVAPPALLGGPRPTLAAFFPGTDAPAAGTALEVARPGGTPVERPMPPRLTLAPRAAIPAMLERVQPDAEGGEALLRTQILPAVEACWAAIRREPVTVQETAFGTPPARPEVSLVVPLHGRVDWMLIQAAIFADDPALQAAAELIYVLDDPGRAREAAEVAAVAHAAHGVPFRLLTLSRNCGYSGATNVGARAARAERLLLLNSDVLPLGPGWLAGLLATHRTLRPGSALGCRLLFDDGTLQHAGMVFTPFPAFRAWLCDHPLKGLPAVLDPAREPRAVPAVTGACLMVSRDAYLGVGGLSEDYVIGDFEDADLCHRLAEAGGEIRYEPRVALTHLERQSFGALGGPEWRYPLTLCNMLIHARRWGTRLQAMAPLPEAGPAPPAGQASAGAVAP